MTLGPAAEVTAGRDTTALPAPPAAAVAVFGDQLPAAEHFARLLATEATLRGLIGPREVPRLWDRHLLNCAVLTDILPERAQVVDIGAGAGLPGIVLALRRPDLRVDLVEPLQRRTVFLDLAVRELDLAGRVRVLRGKAGDATVRSAVCPATWIVARAVAPLERLVGWCLPLLGTDGQLLAMKGRSAEEELRTLRDSSPDVVDGRIVEIPVPDSAPVRVVALTPGRTRSRSERQ